MYLGMAFLYAGFAWGDLGAGAPSRRPRSVDRLVIAREEEPYLERKFGED
jgi:hypothetical protein